MDRVKSAAAASKKFVKDHKTGIAVVVTAGICLTLMRAQVREMDSFLEKHGLLDEYYALED